MFFLCVDTQNPTNDTSSSEAARQRADVTHSLVPVQCLAWSRRSAPHPANESKSVKHAEMPNLERKEPVIITVLTLCVCAVNRTTTTRKPHDSPESSSEQPEKMQVRRRSEDPMSLRKIRAPNQMTVRTKKGSLFEAALLSLPSRCCRAVAVGRRNGGAGTRAMPYSKIGFFRQKFCLNQQTAKGTNTKHKTQNTQHTQPNGSEFCLPCPSLPRPLPRGLPLLSLVVPLSLSPGALRKQTRQTLQGVGAWEELLWVPWGFLSAHH